MRLLYQPTSPLRERHLSICSVLDPLYFYLSPPHPAENNKTPSNQLTRSQKKFSVRKAKLGIALTEEKKTWRKTLKMDLALACSSYARYPKSQEERYNTLLVRPLCRKAFFYGFNITRH
ncbi:hypothetical protein SUGI_0895930 [Cryptomeria japonica]|nr:hypothetical protein SUGI_0895930 [Cryptomeria japonica]